ncbi:hypothetical protein [uncultured Chryseobacterium sp.]|uniref:hypothetical protein n=1 Tax=uncultured Chryseobacterium sp. TaxID=259322 RepID=UPI0027DE7546|nr:hypothetical protein [uncultured Chryseobacterium sp.]
MVTNNTLLKIKNRKMKIFITILLTIFSIFSYGQFSGGTSYTATAPSGGTGYQWFKDGTAITGANTNSYTATTTGTYYATYTSSGETAKSNTYVIGCTAGPDATTTFSGPTTGYSNYQWQSSTNGTTWNNISGATNQTYTTSTGGYYRLTATETCNRTSGTYLFYQINCACSQVVPSAPTLSGTSLSSTCPVSTVNLNSLVTSTTPANTSLVWFTNNAHTGTAYATPTAATTGTYYAFYYDSVGNCYSPASAAVTATTTVCCNAGTTAPALIKN